MKADMALLVPYSKLLPEELGPRLHQLASDNDNAALLELRDLRGIQKRYGESEERAIAKVQEGQRDHADRNPLHFAVVDNKSGDVVGSASRYPDRKLPLSRLLLPIPSVLALGPLVVEYEFATDNVAAWIAGDPNSDANQELLANVYAQLVGHANTRPPATHTWTREPLRTPRGVHEAIAASGLHLVASARLTRFYDGESRRRVPPAAALFANPQGDWLTSLGELHELRTGTYDYSKLNRFFHLLFDTPDDPLWPGGPDENRR